MLFYFFCAIIISEFYRNWSVPISKNKIIFLNMKKVAKKKVAKKVVAKKPVAKKKVAKKVVKK